jgi:hypothetical protein
MTLGVIGARAGLVSLLAACAAAIPRAELDRCNLGVADGNDAFPPRQGAACRMVAERLAADDRAAEAVAYARKSCELEDARGCEQYIALVRGQPSLRAYELPRARAAGEKACSGMVVANDGADARPAICARTAELYLDLAPASRGDAGRLYARACQLGDSASCTKAKTLGASFEELPAPAAAKRPNEVPAGPPMPGPKVSSTASAAPQPVPPCHQMRACVALDVQQRNTTEVVGTARNGCDRTVKCTFCPARGTQVDKPACRSATLSPNESKAGRESGLWYEGYNSIAYDCVDANDDRGCLGP